MHPKCSPRCIFRLMAGRVSRERIGWRGSDDQERATACVGPPSQLVGPALRFDVAGPSSYPYSPECVENRFSDLRTPRTYAPPISKDGRLCELPPPGLFDPTGKPLAFPDRGSSGGINGTVTSRRAGRGTPSRRRPQAQLAPARRPRERGGRGACAASRAPR